MRSLWIKNVWSLLALVYGGSTSAATDKAVDLYLLGIASPVGLFGVTYTEVPEQNWGWQLGLGQGMTGKHFSSQIVYRKDLGNRGWSSSGVMGLSYAAGAEDTKGHSEDFLWLNLSWQLNSRTFSGLRYGLELGVTTVIAEAIFRTNTFRKHEVEMHMLASIDPLYGGYDVGKTLPQISLLKFGYEW